MRRFGDMGGRGCFLNNDVCAFENAMGMHIVFCEVCKGGLSSAASCVSCGLVLFIPQQVGIVEKLRNSDTTSRCSLFSSSLFCLLCFLCFLYS